MESLPNTNRLFKNERYQCFLKKIVVYESSRLFCCHDIEHFLTVARIATIKCFEANEDLSRDLIYTTALLHDIGRFKEYQDKTPHEIASHELACSFLDELDYRESEKTIILHAILNHRNPNSSGFSGIFYQSDKLSRSCFACPVSEKCQWSNEKKNLEIVY